MTNQNETNLVKPKSNGLADATRMRLAILSGADPEILSNTPSGAVNKKARLGGLLLFCGLISGLAMASAAPMFTSPWAAPIVAIIWIFLIISIDRFFITNMDNNYASSTGNGGWQQIARNIGMLILRLGIVAVTSYITSTALEMKIFQTEIDKEIKEKARVESVHVKDSIQNQKNLLYAELDAAKMRLDNASGKQNDYLESIRAEVDALSDSVRSQEKRIEEEIEGTGGSGKKGYSVIAKKKEEHLESEKIRLAEMQAEYERLRMESPSAIAFVEEQQKYKRFLDQHKKDLAELEKAETEALKSVSDNTTYGFQDRYQALNKLKDGENAMLIIMVWLALFIIEMLPIIGKQISVAGPYENAMRLQFQQYYAGDYLQKMQGIEKEKREAEMATVTAQADAAEVRAADTERIVKAEIKEAKYITKMYDAKTEKVNARTTYLENLVEKKNSIMKKISSLLTINFSGKKELGDAQQKELTKMLDEVSKNN